MENIILFRLLEVMTANDEYLNVAARFFDCIPNKPPDDKKQSNKIVHCAGSLEKENGKWCIREGSRITPLVVTSKTKLIGFRNKEEMKKVVHVFAEGHETTNNLIVKIIASDWVYKKVNCLNSREIKHQVFVRLLSLSDDQIAAVIELLTDQEFAENMACCLGHLASAKLSPYFYCPDRNFDLIEKYYNLADSKEIDVYRVLALLDVIGAKIGLTENSPPMLYPPSWQSFFCTYGISHGSSVWNVPGKSIAYVLLKEVPISLPIFMLCWGLDAMEQNILVKDFMRCKAKKKQEEIRRSLIQLLCNGAGLKLKTVYDALHYLRRTGLDNQERHMLTSRGNYVLVIEEFLRQEDDLSP